MTAVPITQKGQDTRNRVLGAARRVIARVGFVALKMSDVANEARLSMGALYRYFENKDDLFLTLIGDIHKDLFEASRARHHKLKNDPWSTLHESNKGYLQHYYTNRDIMRALVEATTMDSRICDMWWWMRQRHIDRFVAALQRDFGLTQVDGVEVRLVVEALASAVEQSAYVWFALENRNNRPVAVDTAAEVLAGMWYRAIWPERGAAQKPASRVEGIG